MKPSFENTPSQLEDPTFMATLREAVADKMDDLVTDPLLDGAGFDLDLGEKIRKGEKIIAGRAIHDALVAVGQDFRLSHDEIDQMREMFLQKTKTN